MPARSKSATPKGSTATLGFEADIGKEHVDPFRNVQHPDLLNASNCFRENDDLRWRRSGATSTTRQDCPEGECGGVFQFNVPPKGNANFAWVQHFIHHLAVRRIAGVDFVCLRYTPASIANGSMFSNQSGDYAARSAIKMPEAKSQSQARQRDIRRALIEADLVDCMVALSGQLVYSTQKFSLH